MGKHKKRLKQVEIVHPNAVGLDIVSTEIFGCVPPDRVGDTVQAFGTFMPDLNRLADQLIDNQVDTAAMESTGVYWGEHPRAMMGRHSIKDTLNLRPTAEIV